MPYWIITFFLGICFLMFFRNLPSLYWLLMFIPLCLFWFITSKNRCEYRRSKFLFWLTTSPKIRKISLQILLFALGFFWALVYVHWIISWSLPPELEGKKILVTGHVITPPNDRFHGISFEFKTKTIASEKKNTKLKLSWYGDYPKLKAGDKWQLLVRLKRPHGVLNPGGFDMEKYLLMHHIRATGYVINSEYNRILKSSRYHYPISRFRQFLISKIEQALDSDELSPIIIALTMGAEDKITGSQWQVMRDTGTSYLVAIAGLHIGLVAGMVFIFAQFFWKMSGYLPLFLPAKEMGILLGLLIGIFYGIISGLSIPSQRSLVMLFIFSLAVLSRRYTNSWNAWLWSLFVVLIINPLSVLMIGFWLSFTAVAAIIYVTSNRIKRGESYLSKFWRMQLTVTLALLPFTLLFFQQFSLVTILANLIAMPGVCMVVVPMSLLGGLSLLVCETFGKWVLWGSTKFLHLVWWWLTFLTNNLNCSWYHPIYNWWILIITSIGIIILLAPRGFPAKSIGLLWLVPLFFYAPPKPKIDNEVWFTLLDVGQGLAALIQTKNHVLLYDTGPKFFENNAGINIVIPYLRQSGIKNIDKLIISHGDSDHSGGAVPILSSLSVNEVLTSVSEKFASYSSRSCVSGQQWQWDGVDFQILSPPKEGFLVGNNASCVLKVKTGINSILFTGDIEKAAENLLVDNYGLELGSTILVAPHHGSATSSTEGLIKLVKPKYVIFPVGYKNHFHFPHKKVVTRYIKNNALLLNVSQTGAITFKFNGKSDILRLSRYREKIRCFWHDK